MKREHYVLNLVIGLSLGMITGCVGAPANNNQSNANTSSNAPAAKTSTPEATTGAIEVVSRPPGANVLLIPTDDAGAGEPQPKGVTPTTIADLQPGTYTVHFEKTGHKFAQKTVEVKAGKTVRVSAGLKRGR